MTENISLRQLIDKVKLDLLEGTSDVYPIFFVDKVELELMVNITQEISGGINVAVVNVAPKISGQQTHVMRITLSPILSKDEQRELIQKDERLMSGIKRSSQIALSKGGKK